MKYAGYAGFAYGEMEHKGQIIGLNPLINSREDINEKFKDFKPFSPNDAGVYDQKTSGKIPSS